MFPNLLNEEVIAYDTETTGFSVNDRVFGFSISTAHDDYYWDIRKTPAAVDWFNDQMKAYKGRIACHNLSFDYRMSRQTSLRFDLDNAYCTSILACLINEHEVSFALDSLAKKYTNSHKSGQALYDAMSALFGGRATKNVQMKRIAEAPVDIVAPYAKDDTRATLDLFMWQMNQVERQRLEDIVAFERSVTPVLIGAEMHGVRVDENRAQVAVGQLSEEIKLMQKQLNDVAGFACNPQPSKDIKKLFKPVWRDSRWWACDGTPLEPTGAGQASLGADALRKMSHPAAKLILELRSLIKTRDTFLVGHVLESAIDSRVYPTINQAKGDGGGTGTGRLSYTGPALQQIPDRNKKIASIVKDIFLPDEGQVWVDADMASFEVRIFAHLVGGQQICKAYADNPETDFHGFVADMTGLVRNATYNGEPNAKQLNLSVIFNQGEGTTAETMKMPWSWESFIAKDGQEVVYKKPGPEAKAVIDKYHQHIPGVKKLVEGCKKVAGERGYLFTRRGRHLRFPNGYKTYKASGILIQSTSADENKENWLRIDEALKGSGGRQLLNTHDSYSMSLPEEDAEKLVLRVKEQIEQDRGLRVPLILEVNKPGKTWWESKAAERWY